jgi:type IV secretory pathway VirB9-like protein
MRWLVALLLTGCGTTKIVQYAPPMRAEFKPEPSLDLSDVSKPFRRDPLAMVDHDVLVAQQTAKEPDAHALVTEANADADTDPRDAEAVGHTQVYVYDPDKQFAVYACAAQIVVLQLAPGEMLSGEPTMGNRTGWAQPIKKTSGDGHGHLIEVLEFRPARPGLGTQLAQLFTNVGPYFLELNVLPPGETSCMRAVRWRHPDRELQRLVADESARKAAAEPAAQPRMSMQYDVEVLEGSPKWVPLSVARIVNGDHAQVVIQLPQRVALSKIPGFLCDNGVCSYRYVPDDHTIIVDGLFNTGVLKMGSKETGYERVVIRALKEAR